MSWFRAGKIILFCSLLIALSVFLGSDWQKPFSLFLPENEIILQLRLWRTLQGCLVGASLAIAGVIFQALLRNPLAEPYILGTSSGAGLATAIAISLGAAASNIFVIPAAGFVGAALSLALVYLLSRVGHKTSPHSLILAGVVWSSFFGSLLMFVVSQSTTDKLHSIVWWFLGDLQVSNIAFVKLGFSICLPTLMLLLFFAHSLNVMTLGDETAHHVGLHPERLRVGLLILASLLTATSVCLSGLIGFVGLIVPHVARMMIGPDHRRLIPVAAFMGGAFLTWADGIGRTVLFPVEIPVGIFTALLGAPYFLYLLRQRDKKLWA